MTAHRLTSLDPGRVALGDNVAAAVLLHFDNTATVSTAAGTDPGAITAALRRLATALEPAEEEATNGR